jgi:hypothetical protein
MGTRNLTMVISKGEYKIAQYGQWDGYPSGQGSVVLNFLMNLDVDLNKFRDTLDRCRFIENSERKQKEIQNFLDKIGSSDGWMNGEQSKKYQKKYPYLTRDNGADILNMVYAAEGDELIWLNNSVDFAADSLFCEWAYLIDLDKNVLEVYQGFNTNPLDKDQRFSNMSKDREDSEYYPIRMIKSYDLGNLPTLAEFVEELEKVAEVEE